MKNIHRTLQIQVHTKQVQGQLSTNLHKRPCTTRKIQKNPQDLLHLPNPRTAPVHLWRRNHQHQRRARAIEPEEAPSRMTVEEHRPGTHPVLLWQWSCARRPQAPMKKSRTTRRTTPSPAAISLYHSVDVNNTTESTPTPETSRSGDNPAPARPSAPDDLGQQQS